MVRFVGSGQSIENAVKILGIKNHLMGVMAEYEYLGRKFGKRGRDWELEMQALIKENGRYYDKMVVRLSDGTKKTIYFDITPFFEEYKKEDVAVNEKKPAYTDGWLKFRVSDVEKAFKILQKYGVDVSISMKEKTIEITFNAFGSTLTIEELISLFQELKSICVPLEDTLL